MDWAKVTRLDWVRVNGLGLIHGPKVWAGLLDLAQLLDWAGSGLGVGFDPFKLSDPMKKKARFLGFWPRNFPGFVLGSKLNQNR